MTLTRCHCGDVVTYGFDGDPTHHRGMCTHCDACRCDVNPWNCGRADYRHPAPKLADYGQVAPSFRILVTGSRYFSDFPIMRDAILQAAANSNGRPVTVVHGGARGADQMAARIARKHGFQVEEHPADWDKHGRRAGPIRNQQMVDAGADICLAFPLGASRGTRGCMAAAYKAGIPVVCPTEP